MNAHGEERAERLSMPVDWGGVWNEFILIVMGISAGASFLMLLWQAGV
ncbi:MAG: hypothetical protein O7H41_07865 [Planctomycetota bacterium]|nr:hypothetical protein [Planctomycetota bacterium]